MPIYVKYYTVNVLIWNLIIQLNSKTLISGFVLVGTYYLLCYEELKIENSFFFFLSCAIPVCV